MGNDANGIVACVKLKFFHLEGGGLNHQRDYQVVIYTPLSFTAPLHFYVYKVFNKSSGGSLRYTDVPQLEPSI
jgi:hypothetical protein